MQINIIIKIIMHKFSPPGSKSCDVKGQLFGNRCTDHTLSSVVYNTGYDFAMFAFTLVKKAGAN